MTDQFKAADPEALRRIVADLKEILDEPEKRNHIYVDVEVEFLRSVLSALEERAAPDERAVLDALVKRGNSWVKRNDDYGAILYISFDQVDDAFMARNRLLQLRIAALKSAPPSESTPEQTPAPAFRTITLDSEVIINGVRYDPGTYQIGRVGEAKDEPTF